MRRGSGGALRRPRNPYPQRGMVTVELAVGILLTVVITASLVGLAMLGVVHASCAETATQVARHTARGDSLTVAEATERRVKGAQIDIQRHAQGVEVRVTTKVAVVGLSPIEVTASAWAAYEPGNSP